MSDTPAKVYALHVEKAVPSLALLPGDVVLIEEAIGPGESYICCHRPLSNGSLPAVVASLLLALDRGRLTVKASESYAVSALLSRLESGPTALAVPQVDAALVRMLAGHDLPREPNGATLTWEAGEREYRDLDDQDPPDGDGWKRGGK